MKDPLNRKPWPMKWVALAILICVVPYTWISIKYRKPGPAYQPYEDTKERANVARLLEAGYRRINVTAERPADPQERVRAMNVLAPATIAAGGLPDGLDKTLVEIPRLPLSFGSVSAPRELAALLPYPVLFTCLLGDQKHQLGGAQVFVRENIVVIVPSFEPLDGNLTARTRESPVLITLPGGSLTTGDHTVILAGSASSQQWPLTVR